WEGPEIPDPEERRVLRMAERRARRRVAAFARRVRLYGYVHGEGNLSSVIKRHAGNLVYLLVSHHHLDHSIVIQRFKQRAGARFVCLIHDTIPAAFPHLSRPGEAARHRRRLETVAQLADAVIVNSASTKQSIDWFVGSNQQRPIVVAHLGVEERFASRLEPTYSERPYFVCVSTIEPKKN